MEATEAVAVEAATGHGIRHGKAETRREMRITIGSGDTTRKSAGREGPVDSENLINILYDTLR